MVNDDLLKKLGLDNFNPETQSNTPPRNSRQSGLDTINTETTADDGPQALVTDEWEAEQAELLTSQGAKGSVEALTDFFAAAYRPFPELTPCVDKTREAFVTGLLQQPAFMELKQSTTHDEAASRLAAADLADQFAALQNQKRPPTKRDVRLAIGMGVTRAQEDIDELKDVQLTLGLGAGDEPGSGNHVDADRLVSAFKRVRGNFMLRRICELAGRYRRAASSQQALKTTHGLDELVGVELSGDVHRLVPSELALLDSDLEMDLLRRLVERQCLSREYRGVDDESKGPIVVVVDESGSMNGEPIAHAKAFALAMAWIARKQNRWCCLASFADATQGRYIVLPPNNWPTDKVTDWLSYMYSGGTSPVYPLETIPSQWESMGCPRGKTDMILLTDGEMRLHPTTATRFNEWKKRENVKMHLLAIGVMPGELAKTADRVTTLNELNIDGISSSGCLAI